MAQSYISSGSELEKRFGYTRAVVDGRWVFVAGTTGYDYATMVISDDPVAQCRQCIANISAALDQAGAALADVVRVQYYLPDAADFELCAPVLRDAFASAPPAATMLVCALVDPAIKIEIEVTALRPA